MQKESSCQVPTVSFLAFSLYRFVKPAPMFLDRNFKKLAKVGNYPPPFGLKKQGMHLFLFSFSFFTNFCCFVVVSSYELCECVSASFRPELNTVAELNPKTKQSNKQT